MARKKQLKEAFRMQKTRVPTSSAINGHEYLQPAEAQWRGAYLVCYIMYHAPRNHDLRDAKGFRYGVNIEIGSEAAAMLMAGNDSPQEKGSKEKEQSNESSQMDVRIESADCENICEAESPKGSERSVVSAQSIPDGEHRLRLVKTESLTEQLAVAQSAELERCERMLFRSVLECSADSATGNDFQRKVPASVAV